MAFDPEGHYQNCQGAVARMTSIARLIGHVKVGRTAHWDPLKACLAAVGRGAASARAEIRAAGADRSYNAAYLSMLVMATNLLGLEILGLADSSVVDADDRFEACRDYANTIRDPLNLGRFAVLGTVPRHDRLVRMAPNLAAEKLSASLGRRVTAGELVPRKAGLPSLRRPMPPV